MHTIKVLGAGLALLAAFLVVGRLLSGASHPGMASAAKYFIAVWFVAAGINLWLGVARAGYSLADEIPVFLLVFAVPAAAALLAWWRLSSR